MATAEAPPQYRQWLDFFFGRDIDDPFGADWEFAASADDKARLFAATMHRCGEDLVDCEERKLATGLQALLMGHFCNLPYEVCHASDQAKAEVVASFSPMYENLLARRSPAVLGHLSEGPDSALAYVTYMVWDVSPLDWLIGLRNKTTNRSLLVEVLGAVLLARPANPAVIESVLHGFGHMVHAHPRHAGEIGEAIDRFLSSRPIVRPELEPYAHLAKSGHVL